jgi:hypothetical protein
MSTDAHAEDFPVTLRVQQDGLNGSAPTLHATIAVDAAGLQFLKKEDRWVQQLTFLTVLENATGAFVAAKQAVMALTPERLAQMREEGIRVTASFSAPQRGPYRVREVVREVVKDGIWASTAPVEVR